MLKNMSGRTANHITITVLTFFLIIAITVTIAQNFTLFVLYDKYQKISAAYTALATQAAGLPRRAPENTGPDYLKSPGNQHYESSLDLQGELFVGYDVVGRTK